MIFVMHVMPMVLDGQITMPPLPELLKFRMRISPLRVQCMRTKNAKTLFWRFCIKALEFDDSSLLPTQLADHGGREAK